jgi:hypothetical protein
MNRSSRRILKVKLQLLKQKFKTKNYKIKKQKMYIGPSGPKLNLNVFLI